MAKSVCSRGKETGRIPTRSKEATVGWGPPVLLAAAAAAGVTYKTTGALTVDAVTKTVESVSSGVSVIDGVVGKIGGAVGALDKGASALPTQAALVGFGVLALYALLGKIMNTAKKTSGDFVKIALFVTIDVDDCEANFAVTTPKNNSTFLHFCLLTSTYVSLF